MPGVRKFAASALSVESNEKDDADILLEEVQNEDDEKSDSEDEAENEYECIKVRLSRTHNILIFSCKFMTPIDSNFQIYFCSRTHSQLSQFIGEVKKTPYKDNIRVVPLASRQTLCVNPNVKKLKSLSLINERYYTLIYYNLNSQSSKMSTVFMSGIRCLEMQKNKSSKATQTGPSKQVIKKKKCSNSCPFNNKTALSQLSDEITIEVKDVEELVSLGQEITACPYYAARAAVRLSQV